MYTLISDKLVYYLLYTTSYSLVTNIHMMLSS